MVRFEPKISQMAEEKNSHVWPEFKFSQKEWPKSPLFKLMKGQT
jgi:hypothetical protein